MKFKYLLITALSAGTLLTSCHKDNLNAAPPTSISDATAFDQPYRIANQVLSLYAQLKEGRVYGGRVLVYGDIRGEEFLLEDPNLVTNADVWNLNPTNSATAVIGLWAQSYTTINNCNLFIDGMNAKGLAVVGPALGNNYIGEARLIRALCYYNLLQYYARPFADGAGSKLGLPLRLTGLKGPGASDLARSTVKEIYTQIISDLDLAEAGLPSTYSGSYNQVTRAHKNTAIALKTRVYLSMQDYSKVISEASKLILPANITGPFVATANIPHALQPIYANVFKTPFTTSESIFSLPFTTTSPDIPGTQNGLQAYYYASASGAGSIFSLNPTGIIGNAQFGLNDTRRVFIFTATSGKKYLTKYPTAAPADYTPVIRWAEVLLNLAEAKVRSTNTIDLQAIGLLNAVHLRGDPTSLPYTAASFATPAALIDVILTERRIEFLGEGLRNNDLMRLLQTIPAKGAAGAKTPSDDGYIWPASATEKSLNKLWVD